jgi:hypothetical protein
MGSCTHTRIKDDSLMTSNGQGQPAPRWTTLGLGWGALSRSRPRLRPGRGDCSVCDRATAGLDRESRLRPRAHYTWVVGHLHL